MLRVASADPGCLDALRLIAELDAVLAALTGDSGAASFDPMDARGPGAAFVIAYDGDGIAVGCGALRPLQDDVGELKRMYARPGSGAGAHILAALERQARAAGYRQLCLSTRRVNLRALRFYARHGYAPVPAYGHYTERPASVCLGRGLVSCA